MIVKARKESLELQMLASLNQRMVLSDKDKLYYLNLKKGYEGELLFDGYLERLTCESMILNDLLLKMNQTTFQIDSMIVTSDCIYVFEVKNYEGDFYYDSETDKIFSKSKTLEIVNPLIQLKRSDTLLRQLLQSFGFSGLRIHSTVVFVNPHFTLYQAPLDKPFIYPTQIERFFEQLNENKKSRLTSKQRMLVEKLLSLHLVESQYSQIPTYGYEELRKGITCGECGSFLVAVEGRNCVCMGCGGVEPVSSAVMRSVREFQMLFPGEKITTKRIVDWCVIVESSKSVRTILENNLNAVGDNRWTYYE